MQSKRIYCYIDETGQDAGSNLFIVSVVIPIDRDKTLEYVERIESQSGKGKLKWGKADPDKRFAYMETLITQRKHPFKIYFSYYKDTKEYKALTILTMFKAIQSLHNFKQQKFIFLVDALGEKDRRYYGAQLHKLGIPSRQVKGIKRDETNGLVRLADSACGFIRDVLEKSNKDKKLASLYKRAYENGILIEV